MQIKGIDPDTGKEVIVEVVDLDEDSLSDLSSTRFTKRKISQQIDQLGMSADAKVLLNKMVTTTIEVGKTIVKIGQKILEIVISIAKAYPNTSFGLVLGCILGLLIAGIPIIGAVLSTIAMPLLSALGALYGAKIDLDDKAMEARIKKEIRKFDILKSEQRGREDG